LTKRSIERKPPTLQRELDEFRRLAQTGDVDGVARVVVFEDKNAFTVKIDFGSEDEHAIVLTYWKDARDGVPSVS
jgi:hypothetical protein